MLVVVPRLGQMIQSCHLSHFNNYISSIYIRNLFHCTLQRPFLICYRQEVLLFDNAVICRTRSNKVLTHGSHIYQVWWYNVHRLFLIWSLIVRLVDVPHTWYNFLFNGQKCTALVNHIISAMNMNYGEILNNFAIFFQMKQICQNGKSYSAKLQNNNIF